MPGNAAQSAVAVPSAGRRWTVRDAIDFEHLAQRDRIDDAPRLAGAPAGDDRRVVFLQWLDQVRAGVAAPLPGETYTNGRQLVQWLAIVAGVVCGFGVCGALLARRDAEPVNALLFFAVTVGIQLGFIVLVALAWPLRRAGLRAAGLRRVVLSVVGAFGRAVDRLDGDRRATVRAQWAALDFRSDRLGPLVGCQLLLTTQVFAIAFNVGLLASMLFIHLPFEELRFGWQSTYRFTAAGVDAWVRLVSAPWRWIADGLAPDASQVATTRFVRGQRAETLPANAGHAWWPFLLSAIAFYGLALRTALAVVAAWLLRRRLAALTFTHAAANALWRKLAGPLVTASGGDATLPAAQSARPARQGTGVDVLVVDDDLATRRAEIRALAERVFGGALRSVVAANIDDESSTTGLGTIAGSVVIATLASRDPIVAVAGFLRTVRALAGERVEITVLLVGDEAGSAVPAERISIWRRFTAIHRLDVGVEQAS